MVDEPLPNRRPAALTKLLQSSHGVVQVRAQGLPRRTLEDSYHTLLRIRWSLLIGLLVAIYVVANLFFAALYTIDGAGVSVAQGPAIASHYWRMFFFSVDTMATIGYGNMYPVSPFANALVLVEVIFGILFTAFATGIGFARFSRPTARIIFSNVAVVQLVDGVPVLMFRAANQRHNLIFEAEVRVSVLADETIEGTTYRRFKDLKVERAANPLFTLSWTIMHRIEGDSPLKAWLTSGCVASDAEIVVVLSGTDAHTGQIIHGRWGYGSHDIRWGERLVDIIGRAHDGARTIDYRRFHDTEPTEPART